MSGYRPPGYGRHAPAPGPSGLTRPPAPAGRLHRPDRKQYPLPGDPAPAR